MRYSKSRRHDGTKKFLTGVVVLAIVAIASFVVYGSGLFGPGTAEEAAGAPLTEEQRISALADCLTASGTRLYGASWCPHCQNQKAAFGAAMDRIAYVECADAQGENGRSAACAEAKVASYPTWIFGDGTRLTGERSFWELARQSGCEW